MATREIALLRGINVGRAKRIAMADLRRVVEGLGFSEVRTLLNSGNVVFTAARASKSDASRIEKAIESELGVSSRVVVLTASELAAINDANPLNDVADNPSRLLVAVPYDREDLKRLKPLLKEEWGAERLAVGAHAAYIWCADGIADSKLVVEAGRVLKDAVTTRNWGTMMKLQALAEGE